MSPLGMVAWGQNQETLFLGREINRSQDFSEETSRKIDAEIYGLINEQYNRAKSILIEHRAALDILAQSLLQYETLEGRHVKEISISVRSVRPWQRSSLRSSTTMRSRAKARGLRQATEGSPARRRADGRSGLIEARLVRKNLRRERIIRCGAFVFEI